MTADAKDFGPEPFSLPVINGSAEYSLHYTGKPGYFIIINGISIELWNLASSEKIKEICLESGFYKLYLQDNGIYFVYRQHMHIYEN
jgi:hypothetical protein